MSGPSPEAGVPDPHQYCTFYLAGTLFGVGVLGVREVLRSQPTTPVPLAHPAVRGIINLRGQIATAIDLRRRLGLPDRDGGGPPPVNVVVGTDDGPVGLLVDEVGDVLAVAPEAFEPPPETLAGPARELVRGVYKLDGRLLLVLDAARAVALPHPAPNHSPSEGPP